MKNTIEKETVEKLQKEIQALQYENEQLKNKQIEIDKAKELYLHILEEFPALIWRANKEKLCDYFNTTWLEFTGKTMKQEYGNGWLEGVHPDDIQHCSEIYTSNFDKKEPFSMEYRLKNSDGEYRWILDYGRPYFDLDGSFLGYIGSCYDITDKKLYEQRLKELSEVDSLTKVYNRLKLDSLLEYELVRANRYGSTLSVIMVDVDNFKSVNDTYGHIVGDKVLIQITQIMKNNIRTTDILGRWGGEEFLVICPETDSKNAESLATKLMVEVQKHAFPKVEAQTCSFGVSSYKKNDDYTKLVHRADKALYTAKEDGKNQVKVVL